MHDRPTSGFGGHIHRATTMRIDAIGRHLQIQQTADQRRRDVVGGAGQHQRVAAVAIDGQHIGLARDQAFEHRAARLPRGIQPRRATEQIARFQIGSRRQQRLDDVAVAGQCGFVQGAATLAVAGIHARLVLEQQLHAGRIVFFGSGCGQQHRGAALGFGMRAAFQQEFGQPPVADLAGHRQRRVTFIIERVQFGSGIAQQRGHARVGTAHGVMQRGIAVVVARARVSTVGQQGHHRVRATVPAVAGGSQQRGHAAVRLVDVDAAHDQLA